MVFLNQFLLTYLPFDCHCLSFCALASIKAYGSTIYYSQCYKVLVTISDYIRLDSWRYKWLNSTFTANEHINLSTTLSMPLFCECTLLLHISFPPGIFCFHHPYFICLESSLYIVLYWSPTRMRNMYGWIVSTKKASGNERLLDDHKVLHSTCKVLWDHKVFLSNI